MKRLYYISVASCNWRMSTNIMQDACNDLMIQQHNTTRHVCRQAYWSLVTVENVFAHEVAAERTQAGDLAQNRRSGQVRVVQFHDKLPSCKYAEGAAVDRSAPIVAVTKRAAPELQDVPLVVIDGVLGRLPFVAQVAGESFQAGEKVVVTAHLYLALSWRVARR